MERRGDRCPGSMLDHYQRYTGMPISSGQPDLTRACAGVSGRYGYQCARWHHGRTGEHAAGPAEIARTEMRKPPLIYVEFLDHASSSSWRDVAEIPDNGILCCAVGFKLKETKHALVLGSFVDPNDMTSCSRSYIIKGTITKRRTLHIDKPRRKK